MKTKIFPFRLEKLAEAHRQRVIIEAEAEAEAIRLSGEASAYAIEAKGATSVDSIYLTFDNNVENNYYS